MRTPRFLFLGTLMGVTALTGCGGAGSRDASRPDQDYLNAMEVGRDSFDLTHADQAKTQFETAYGRALLRDDVLAIRDAGYNLAVAELAMGDAKAALDTVRRVHGDMALRGDAPSPALDLVAVAAYCRLGQNTQAIQLVRQISTDDPALVERRAFLQGIAADELGDMALLSTSLNALPVSPRPPRLERADRAELTSRLLLRQGQFAQAEAQALVAVDLRRDMLDYRGLARALDGAARAAQAAGETSRAATYRDRAMQSRAQLGDKG
ncbi:hypothetical protein [Asaia bogorensis]|uniref:hypothetical protein n=1 Tax=Asaia bogorensis TaxID=91915 RepID=UPI0013CE9985|nr:hypothetical protein [Asaia bogorensis]